MTAMDIIARLPESFEKARASGDLFFFPSTIHKHEELSAEWEIRLCPALQKKPHLPTPHFEPTAVDEPTKDFDPFAPPYNPNLHLNKYSIVYHHFLLVTKEFKSQASPLMPPDLAQSYLLLAAASKAGKHFFGFYNCGDNSGASQPHKHVQFIPLDDPAGPPVERLARAVTLETLEKPFTIAKLPYANHVFRLPNNCYRTHPTNLNRPSHEVPIRQTFIQYPPDPEHMHLIPRRYETHTLSVTGERLSINALGFAGMLLVKSETELDAVKRETVSTILRSVGLKSVHDLQVAGLCAVGGDDTMC
ncbi:hypothetical protein BD779DRAFT_975539 [Infundibulicybe gibba]|nr:hypothetical protein BD779DRAFT_975539 [Infundibulicybe gibba]